MVTTGWIIAGGIIAFIVIMLAIPVVIRFEYGEQLYLRVRYLFVTLYRLPPKLKKQKRKKAKKPSAVETTQAPSEPPKLTLEQKLEEIIKAEEKLQQERAAKSAKKEKNPKIPTLTEIFELVKAFVDSLSKPLKKLLKRIKIIDFRLEMICGGEDAAKAALKFGAVNLAVGNALGHLGSWFTLKDPSIDINVDFQSEQTKTECSCTVKLSALVLLIFVFSFVGRIVSRVIRNKVIRGYLGRLTARPKKAKKGKRSKKD